MNSIKLIKNSIIIIIIIIVCVCNNALLKFKVTCLFNKSYPSRSEKEIGKGKKKFNQRKNML